MATNGLTRREAREIALDRRVTLYDAQARDEGHSPAPWAYTADDDGDLTAATRCTACGRDAAIRVGDDREWWGGKMRLWRCVS